jgi:hypothetical protein
MHSSSSSPTSGGGGYGCPYFGGTVNRKERATQTGYQLVKNKMQDQRWKHTLSQASYPALTSVLLTLQVAISGRVRTRRAWGESKVKHVLLKRRCSLEGQI